VGQEETRRGETGSSGERISVEGRGKKEIVLLAARLLLETILQE